jgi:hypothetical protein
LVLLSLAPTGTGIADREFGSAVVVSRINGDVSGILVHAQAADITLFPSLKKSIWAITTSSLVNY